MNADMDKVQENQAKLLALFLTLWSIPRFLRGEFLIEWSLIGFAFAIIQLTGIAICVHMLFDFVRSRSQSSEQTPMEAEE